MLIKAIHIKGLSNCQGTQGGTNDNKGLFPENDEDKKSLGNNKGHAALDSGGPSSHYRKGKQ